MSGRSESLLFSRVIFALAIACAAPGALAFVDDDCGELLGGNCAPKQEASKPKASKPKPVPVKAASPEAPAKAEIKSPKLLRKPEPKSVPAVEPTVVKEVKSAPPRKAPSPAPVKPQTSRPVVPPAEIRREAEQKLATPVRTQPDFEQIVAEPLIRPPVQMAEAKPEPKRATQPKNSPTRILARDERPIRPAPAKAREPAKPPAAVDQFIPDRQVAPTYTPPVLPPQHHAAATYPGAQSAGAYQVIGNQPPVFTNMARGTEVFTLPIVPAMTSSPQLQIHQAGNGRLVIEVPRETARVSAMPVPERFRIVEQQAEQMCQGRDQFQGQVMSLTSSCIGREVGRLVNLSADPQLQSYFQRLIVSR